MQNGNNITIEPAILRRHATRPATGCSRNDKVFESAHHWINLPCGMTKQIFKALARINKAILPRYSKADITKLSKIDKAIVAYRYWVTIHALD
jgi:hypothetical protein